MKYFRVFRQFIRNSVSYLTAYRSDFVLKLFLGAGWSLTWIAMIEIFFSHTNSFNGWSKNDVLLIIFSFQFLEFNSVFAKNIESVESQVLHGNFDFVVTKPIDSQFLCTCDKPELSNIIFFFSYQIPILILLIQNKTEIVWANLPLYLLLLLSANIIWLSIRTLCAATNFWKQKVNNLIGMSWAIMEFGRYPMTLFPKKLQILFYSFVPAAFIGFVPASVLLGRTSWIFVFFSFVTALLFFVTARLVWNAAIKKYSSASS